MAAARDHDTGLGNLERKDRARGLEWEETQRVVRVSFGRAGESR